ncbi:MAG: hypothetical protein DMG98_03345 [Acidobacteria bacterium]|nr:MAG: hypothetical protein DMG98_03345 [Acidobacteriota bacterium]
MDQVGPVRRETILVRFPHRIWRRISIGLIAASAALLIAVLTANVQRPNVILEATEEEFRQMAGNIQEVFWTIDPKSKKVLYVNEAYEAITGRPCQSLMENPDKNKRRAPRMSSEFGL